MPASRAGISTRRGRSTKGGLQGADHRFFTLDDIAAALDGVRADELGGRPRRRPPTGAAGGGDRRDPGESAGVRRHRLPEGRAWTPAPPSVRRPAIGTTTASGGRGGGPALVKREIRRVPSQALLTGSAARPCTHETVGRRVSGAAFLCDASFKAVACCA